ncbi:MAG: sigma-54 dependent transcriptional regulator [Polyangia bacterium]|jgi:DNA-binding NtrC family response regulator|nr:sigma-54 dependent transcriptional regulator [Polyangia bacterium]
MPNEDHLVLVVDDEKNIRRTLRMVLEGEGYRVEDAPSAERALEMLGEVDPDLVLMDVKLPAESGLWALERIMSGAHGEPPVPVIMISGHATFADAVQATRLGADDFIEKPIDRQRVLVSVRNALERASLRRDLGKLQASLEKGLELVGTSEVMRSLFAQIAKVAPTKGRVLILGESGTGKELIARALHRQSLLSGGPFVKVNCAAIPPELIESELFGHEKGAFTGAVSRKRGLFEVASGGTIFLDEIGDMSLSAQAKVLRTLQSGEITRVGGELPVVVDVRVVAATNQALEELVAAGRFREDLYFRLNVVPIRSPALRERASDIPMLVEHFVGHFCRENDFRPKRVAPEVLHVLSGYRWPGNVRELKNLCERLVILSGQAITVDDLPPEVSGAAELSLAPQAYGHLGLKEFKDEMERAFILQRLKDNNWNISRTAASLGIERTNLHKKLKAYDIQRQER